MRHEEIYLAVRRVPPGRVATYGQIARLAGSPGAARQVGYALAALPEATAIPWHRILNARGAVSLRRGGGPVTQRIRLEREGVRFGLDGRVQLSEYGWSPDSRNEPNPSGV